MVDPEVSAANPFVAPLRIYAKQDNDMQLHIEVQNCCPRRRSKALPWSVKTLTFALVLNPESHHLIHWLSAMDILAIRTRLS